MDDRQWPITIAHLKHFVLKWAINKLVQILGQVYYKKLRCMIICAKNSIPTFNFDNSNMTSSAAAWNISDFCSSTALDKRSFIRWNMPGPCSQEQFL